MKNKSPAPKTADAAAFLKTYLAKGMKPAPEVYREALLQGIARRTLQDAAESLNIDRSQRKGHIGHFWSLPSTHEVSVPEGTPLAKARFLIALERASLAGCLTNDLIAELAESAIFAISESELISSQSLFGVKLIALKERLLLAEGSTGQTGISKVTPWAQLDIQLDVLKRARARHEDNYIFIPTMEQLKAEFIKEYEAAIIMTDTDSGT